MGIFDFFINRNKRKLFPKTQSDLLINIKYDNSIVPTVTAKMQNESCEYNLKIEYVGISTSGDENVCPMCSQFEGKIFAATDAPKLPLCPSCSCAYMHYFKEDLPPDAKISSASDFVLPADCAPMIYKVQQRIYNENDMDKCIRLCRRQLKSLNKFMQPYISSAGFPSPDELACRDLLPDLYMQLGKWEDAKNTIQACIEAKAYYPENVFARHYGERKNSRVDFSRMHQFHVLRLE